VCYLLNKGEVNVDLPLLSQLTVVLRDRPIDNRSSHVSLHYGLQLSGNIGNQS
jgi:hypothetical protein